MWRQSDVQLQKIRNDRPWRARLKWWGRGWSGSFKKKGKNGLISECGRPCFSIFFLGRIMVNSNSEGLLPVMTSPQALGINHAGRGISEQAEGPGCLKSFAERPVGLCVLPTRFLMAGREEKPSKSMFPGGSLLIRQTGKYLRNGRCCQSKPRLMFSPALWVTVLVFVYLHGLAQFIAVKFS